MMIRIPICVLATKTHSGGPRHKNAVCPPDRYGRIQGQCTGGQFSWPAAVENREQGFQRPKEPGIWHATKVFTFAMGQVCPDVKGRFL